MANWKEVLIADLKEVEQVDIQTGPFGTQFKAHEYVEEGIPMINVKNIGMGKIRPDKMEFISDRTAKRLKNHLLKKNDIVFGRKGAVERHVFIRKEQEGWIQGSDCIRVRFDSKNILPEYVSYYLCTQYHQIWINNLASSGATMSSLNQEIIGRIKFNLPTFSIQSKIVSVLSNYDKLIENNNRRIAILEEMAEEIYKEWFVRLRFPNWDETKVVDGIPEGWAELKLGDLCDIQMGQSPKSEFYNENGEGLPFHQGVTNFQQRFPIDKKYCTDLKRIADPYDILLSVRAPVGRINIVKNRMIIGRGLCSVKANNGNQNYFYYLLKDIFKYEDSFGNGAVFNAVSKSDLERIPVSKSDISIEKQFQNLIQPIDEEIRILTEKNIILQKTRDLLLPRLISGKLSVEHLIESK